MRIKHAIMHKELREFVFVITAVHASVLCLSGYKQSEKSAYKKKKNKNSLAMGQDHLDQVNLSSWVQESGF